MRTKPREACSMACLTSGRMSVPLNVVSVPTALMNVRTPRRSYAPGSAGLSREGTNSQPAPTPAAAPAASKPRRVSELGPFTSPTD